MAELSRRQLMTAGAAGTATLLVNGSARAAGNADTNVLQRAIRAEQEAALAYAEIADSPRLSPRLKPVVRQLRGQEREHADTLIRALGYLGGVPPAKPTQVPGLAKALAGDQRTILEFAMALEDRLVGVYHEASRRLTDSKLLETCATISGSEGQHLVVLRQALHQNPVPSAFQTGRPA